MLNICFSASHYFGKIKYKIIIRPLFFYKSFITLKYMNIYQERLMDHYRHPRNKGIIESPDFSSKVHNPLCGDAISFTGCISHNIITALAFDGFGCVISQAAASLLTEEIVNKPVDFARNFSKEAMIKLVALECGPTRLKCVLLAWDALQEALNNAQSA